MRSCAKCLIEQPKVNFSASQWKKKALAECKECVNSRCPPVVAVEQPPSSLEIEIKITVSELSSGTQSVKVAAAQQIFAGLKSKEITWQHLVRADAIIPLLVLVQAVRRNSQGIPIKSTRLNSKLCLAGGETALRILSVLMQQAQSVPEQKDPDDWVTAVLLDLEASATPHLNKKKQLEWPVRVVSHTPASAQAAAVTVVDVVTTEERRLDDAQDEKGQARTEEVEVVIRQLVLGPWQGRMGFRDSEMNITPGEQPGQHLENWYATTLAGLLSLGRRLDAQSHNPSQEPGRLLVIGCGAGVLPLFLATHYPEVYIDVVEINETVVDVARKHFGLQCSVSHGLKRGNSPDNTHVYVMDGSDYVHQTLQITSARKYDGILLDVYTAGYFPPSLCSEKFFVGLSRLLRDRLTGTITLNAGIGPHVSKLRQYMTRIMSNVGVFVNEQSLPEQGLEGAQADIDTENLVIMGIGSRHPEPAPLVDSKQDLSVHHCVSTEAWQELQKARSCSPNISPFPFSLVSVTETRNSSGQPVLRIMWGEPEDVPVVAAAQAKLMCHEKVSASAGSSTIPPVPELVGGSEGSDDDLAFFD